MTDRRRWSPGNRAAVLLLGLALALAEACTATPQPDVPQVVNPVDPDRMRIDLSGPDLLRVTGLAGAADRTGTDVRVQSLTSEQTVEVPIAPDGSFVAEVSAPADQVLSVVHSRGDEVSQAVFLAGNARREAVPVGTATDCEPVPQPTPDVCLTCRPPVGPVVEGCRLDDFTDQAVLNPANVGECLFLSTDVLVVEPTPVPEEPRVGGVSVFNGCGTPALVRFRSLEALFPERFELQPPPGFEPLIVDPTFFGHLEVRYFGAERAPEDPPDEAVALVDVTLPPPPGGGDEVPLGTMVLTIMAP